MAAQKRRTINVAQGKNLFPKSQPKIKLEPQQGHQQL
jgi:hypothetical protein